MFDISLKKDLAEVIARNLNFYDIELIGKYFFKNYDTRKLENISEKMTISKLTAARRLVFECEQKNKLKDLFIFVIELDGNLLNEKKVTVDGLENLLYKLTQSGLYYDFEKRKLVTFDQEKKILHNWGSLKEGKEYSLVITSIDICKNSELVRKYKHSLMEKIYFKLWAFLRDKLTPYNGRIWTWAGDGGLLAFREKDGINQAVCCCLDILFTLPIFNSLPDIPIKDDICIRMGMDCGKIKYHHDTGRIVSDVINYAAHLEKKGTPPRGLSLSANIYKNLSANLKKVFMQKQEFEGKTAYSLVFDYDI